MTQDKLLLLLQEVLEYSRLIRTNNIPIRNLPTDQLITPRIQAEMALTHKILIQIIKL